LAFGIVLGIIVIVHEFGHYIAARLMGVRVETFSFGFGKRILGKKVGDTDFRLSLIPLGGYVKMAGEEEWDPENLKPDEFQAKNRGQKIFILVMGPLFNLLLAFAIFTIINITGVKAPAYKSEPPVIGYVEKGSAAEAADIQKGDRIVTINGKAVENWDDLELVISSSPEETLDVEIERDGQLSKKKMDVGTISTYRVGHAGLQWYYRTEVASLTKGEPAEAAGIKEGDVIYQVDGAPVSYFEFSDAINESEGKKLTLQVLRGEEKIDVELASKKVYRLESQTFKTLDEATKMLEDTKSALPELEFGISPKDGLLVVVSKDLQTMAEAEKFQKMSTLKVKANHRWIIGIAMMAYSPKVEKHYALFAAMGKSTRDLVKYTVLVFNAFKKMIVGKLSPKNLSGPMEIAEFSRKAMESGPTNFFMLIAFISLQLGIVNLFPIPALDGGHLMIFSIEAVLRKDFSQKVKNILMNIGFFILIALMVFVILNDIAKKLPNGWSSFLPF
jgi:regulator of sigma E protease